MRGFMKIVETYLGESDGEILAEKRTKKAERFIKKHKEEFKDRYGDNWERVLYATANKRFNK